MLHRGHVGGSRKKTKFLQLGFKVYKVNLEIISDLRKKRIGSISLFKLIL